MKKFEYMTREIVRSNMVNKLNVLGNKGWEVVDVVDHNLTSLLILFKREFV